MAIQYKENSVYYYQIMPHFIKKDDEEIKLVKGRFKKAFKFTNDSKEFEQGDGSVNAIEANIFETRYIEGALIYTLERNLPPKIDADGKSPSMLDIDGFRGLGYDSAYVYDSELMILAIESRVPGATLASLQSLIYINNDSINTFDYKIVGSPKEYQRFLDSHGVRSMEMEVLNIDEIPKKIKPVRGIDETIDLVEAANGTKIEIRITTGQNKFKMLNKNFISTIADYALKSIGGQNEVSKFKLNIVDVDSGRVEPVDLITGRIKDKTKIEKVRAINRFSIAEKISQIKGGYLRRRPDLETIIKI